MLCLSALEAAGRHAAEGQDTGRGCSSGTGPAGRREGAGGACHAGGSRAQRCGQGDRQCSLTQQWPAEHIKLVVLECNEVLQITYGFALASRDTMLMGLDVRMWAGETPLDCIQQHCRLHRVQR